MYNGIDGHPDVIKHMLTTSINYENSSRDNEKSALLRTGLAHTISRLWIILSLSSFLSLFRIKKYQRM